MTRQLGEIWVYLSATPLLGLTVTLLAYLLAYRLYERVRFNPLANPVAIAVVLLVLVLTVTRTPYATYFEGAQFVHFLLGPATVALALPLYDQRAKLKRLWIPLTLGLTAGVVTAIVSAVGIAWALGASEAIVAADAPSSQAIASAETIATTTPTSRPTLSANQARRSFGICSNNGTASATVAGPSRKWTNCAPSK